MPLVLFNPLIEPYQVLPRRARVDLGAMAMKECSVFTIRRFSVISRSLIAWGVLPLCRCAVSIFYSPSRLGKQKKTAVGRFFNNKITTYTSNIHSYTWLSSYFSLAHSRTIFVSNIFQKLCPSPLTMFLPFRG